MKQLGHRLPKRFIPVFFDLQGRTHTALDRYLWWLAREIVAPGEEETQTSAEEWLRSGKHEDLRETKGVLPKFKGKYWPLLADIAKELSFEFAAAGAMELIKVLM